MMNTLESLPNIGKTLAKKLALVGIHTPDDLKQVGAESAFIKLFTIDETSCINLLFALEGAVEDIRWHQLPAIKKQQLKEFFLHCHS